MSKAWYPVEGKYRIHRKEVIAFCEQHFGQQHKQWFNPTTKRKMDNHGNWTLTFNGVLQLRYKRDITWFMLMSGHLMDKEIW